MIRLIVALLCLHSSLLYAQAVYRYVDKEGRVVLSDHPPKGVAYERFDYDKSTNVLESPKRTQGTQSEKAGVGNEKSRQRSALRDSLRGEVDKARARLAAAREALVAGQDPTEDEWQPTVTAPDNGGKPNSKGVITGRGGRVVCHTDGSGRVVCPAVPVPSQAYRERIEGLERAVKDAEEALKVAEARFRRNAPD